MVEGWRWRGRRRTATRTYRQQDIIITNSRLCGTLGDTVMEQKDSSPVGLPIGHLTGSSVDHGVVATKQRWFSSSPAHLVSTLEHCLHTTWQHHPRPGHTHHRLCGVRRHTSCNNEEDPFFLQQDVIHPPICCLILHQSWISCWLGLKKRRSWDCKLFNI